MTNEMQLDKISEDKVDPGKPPSHEERGNKGVWKKIEHISARVPRREERKQPAELGRRIDRRLQD